MVTHKYSECTRSVYRAIMESTCIYRRSLMMDFFLPVLAAFLFISPSWSAAASDQDNPIEIGHVSWSRDYHGALQASRHSGKPVFLFFQEVPGCLGCRTFGSQVLTHPLLVEAVEDEFIPVLVYNNRRTGMDAQLLKQYGEPSWNYQVIRFVDANERDLIPRRDRVWDIGSLAARMVAALKAADRSVPLYLSSLAVEYDTSHLQTAVFG
ncbi:MAG: thioredoxin family protein, partial [Desulfobulbaceae bacterium]